ncbi:DUF1674 domain-containing protein [Kaustia mangrovi]|uniref:DUF1674 domain-containing protein n=1 Tax=Kaustia mangrovi TaxID=2593653 RepID=A0A7S8C4N7_9HYPH|nr:DUF1674 domain-containing protein [Kaustia mangrovi]QPC43293.1 DUF1674 domain-containing protein [Kaustia mangrovi]
MSADRTGHGDGAKAGNRGEGANDNLPPAARRALEEAAARRAEIDARATARPKEINGADGPEPTRYGDWEKKGLTSDF